MPISAENRKRYPANWRDLRSLILQRAQHCCEQCGVPNYTRIIRGHGPDAGTFMIVNHRTVYNANTGAVVGDAQNRDYVGQRRTLVILNVAHLDHTPEHNDLSNLRALCCRCHLLHDAAHHRQTAYLRRRQRRALGDLFADVTAVSASSRRAAP